MTDPRSHLATMDRMQGALKKIVLNGNGNDDHARIPNTWILLDKESTVDVFHNPNLLQNIHKTDTYMDIHCNAGITSTNEISDLHRYGTVGTIQTGSPTSCH